MAIPRPKMLTAVTVPTGGWIWTVYLTNVAQYDVEINATIPAGTYYMAADNQSDCFLFVATTALRTAITDDGTVPYNLMMDINSSHKIRIHFDDDGGGFDNDIKIAWTEDDGDEVAKVFGFDESADDESTTTDNPTFTGDYQHAYGWYADEDGLLADLLVADMTEFMGLQSRALSGKVKTQQLVANRLDSKLALQFLTRKKAFSENIGYTAAPLAPYNRNEGIECWWVEARKGTQFRVYRDGYILAARAGDRGTETAANTTTLTDSGKSWSVEPQTWKNRILHIDDFGGVNSITQNWHIASHTATILTVSNAHPSGYDIDNDTANYYLFDHYYQTYVVNLGEMTKFEPSEIPQIDRYDVEIPLFRYV